VFGLPRATFVAAGMLCVLTPAAAAQSTLERSPNLSGGWTGPSGTVHFNFLHRFSASGPPQRKVTSAPTFLVALGLPGRTLLGFQYATNSQLVASYPNEWEYFGRFAPFLQDAGSPVDVGLQAGYNLAAQSVDGEVSLARRIGPVRLLAAGRAFSNAFDSGEARFALGAGASVRVSRWVAVAGDVVSLLDRAANEDPTWSAALQVQIPYTPHTLSLQATNVNTATLQGASRGTGTVRYGFEFTIPLTLSRYFGRGAPPVVSAPPAGAAGDPAGEAKAAAEAAAGSEFAASIQQLAYAPARIEVPAGTTIVWTNRDPVAHTVTAEDGSWDSGLIQPGATWRRTFDRPGTYPFICTPHPFMKGVVVVR
jgi:plastocyanin